MFWWLYWQHYHNSLRPEGEQATKALPPEQDGDTSKFAFVSSVTTSPSYLAPTPTDTSVVPSYTHHSAQLPLPSAMFEDEANALLDAEGNLLRCCYRWSQVTGLDETYGLHQPFAASLHPDSVARYHHGIITALPGRPSRMNVQLHHTIAGWRWFLLAVEPLGGDTAAGGAAYRMALRDIESEMDARHHLQKAKLEAELALKGRSDFLAQMSHELRTPLNAILGFSEIMQSQLFGAIPNRKYMDYVTGIHESGQNLLGKISDLLEIATIETGRLALREEEIPLTEMLRGIAESYAHKAFSAHITIAEQLPEIPVMLNCDRLKCTHAISNLMSNALTASKESGLIELRANITPSGKLLVQVRDSGGGIAPEKLALIGDVLTAREDRFLQCHRHGLGLGIAIAKTLIEAHNGTLYIESAPGVGTTATFTFPAWRVHPVYTEEAPEMALPVQAAVEETYPFTPLNQRLSA